MSDQHDDSQLLDTAAQLRERLVKHLKEDNFVLYFQPIVLSTASGVSTQFREILVRYKEEEEDMLPPGSFLPILEEQGLLPLLDRWVVGKLLKWGRDVQAAGQKMPHCSVNIAIDTVRRDEAFGDYVLKGLQKMNVQPAALTFEVMTVEALAFPQALARMIPPMRAAGVTFALSWFNGEEAAFDLAPALGISYIKIDGGFAVTIARQPKEKARLTAIVQRCHKLGLRTVCMHVEDAETLEHMRSIRVDFVQGFGIARPRAIETI